MTTLFCQTIHLFEDLGEDCLGVVEIILWMVEEFEVRLGDKLPSGIQTVALLLVA